MHSVLAQYRDSVASCALCSIIRSHSTVNSVAAYASSVPHWTTTAILVPLMGSRTRSSIAHLSVAA
eukprot:3941697-Rhodomonas_salina.1